jgi:HK97 family phage portal protein
MAWLWGKSQDELDKEETTKLQETIAKLEIEYEEKLNPAQEEIADDQLGSTQNTSRYTSSHIKSYNTLEVVNRGVNVITDAVGEFNFDAKGKIANVTPIVSHVRAERLLNLLNYRANKYTSASEFKRQIAMELILEGNAFIYFDGAELYILPSINVEIVPDKKDFIKKYIYDNTDFSPKEIIHIRENSADSIYRGATGLSSAVESINILQNMNSYQKNFFKNNTILGVVLKTPDMLSNKLKQRKVLEWMRDYNPTQGGRRPLILDGGYEIEDLSKYSFKELDFAESILTQERKILEALGVPPILLDSGNNANISPNLKLLYTNTVLPIVQRIVTSFELYFGIDLKPVTADIMALRPDLREQSNYYSTLVNAGIMTRNEAREVLRLEKYDDPKIGDTLILPANIAGSAANSSVGGRPTEDNED